MFVDGILRVLLGEARLVRSKRRDEKPRLLQQPPRPAIDVRARFERTADEPFEIVNGPMLPPQRVIQRQHFRDEPRPHLERRTASLRHRRIRRAPEQHLAGEVVEHRRRIRQALREMRIEATARDHRRQDDGRPAIARGRAHQPQRHALLVRRLPAFDQPERLQRVPQLIRRAGRRHHDHGVAHLRERRMSGGQCDGPLKRTQARDTQQAGDARSNH